MPDEKYRLRGVSVYLIMFESSSDTGSDLLNDSSQAWWSTLATLDFLFSIGWRSSVITDVCTPMLCCAVAGWLVTSVFTVSMFLGRYTTLFIMSSSMSSNVI